MSPTSHPRDLRLPHLTEEELLLLAPGEKAAAHRPACWALVLRHLDEIHHLVACLAREGHLQEADELDAGQTALCDLDRAVSRYDPTRSAAPGGEGLMVFLRTAVRRRFRNFTHGRRRTSGRFDAGGLHLEGEGGWSSDADNPLALAMANESARQRGDFLQALPETERRLAQGRAAGRQLQEMAEELGIPLRTAGRHWQYVKARVCLLFAS